SKLENTYRVQLSDINDAANVSRFNIFKSRDRAIEIACEEFVNTVNTEASYIHEIERRTAAIAFYRKMIERLEEIQSKMKRFEGQLTKVVEDTTRQIQQIKNRRPREPFTIHVTPIYISQMQFDTSDVDVDYFLNKRRLSDLVFQNQLEVSELYNRITSYSNSLEKTNKYKETTILDALEKLPQEKVKDLFGMLKSSIGILRRLDPSCNINSAKNYVVGVYDVSHPALIDRSKVKNDAKEAEDEKNDDLDIGYNEDPVEKSKKARKKSPNLGDILRSEFDYQGRAPELSNTKDKNKIIVSSYESAAPAFLVKNFDGYAFDLEHKNKTIPEELRYSNKFWGDIIMKRNYSIFPKNDDDAIKTWALAFFVSKVEKEKHGKAAHQFIIKPKNKKYAVYTTSGDKATKDLHAYRPKAFEMFKEQQQLVDQLLPILQQKIKDDLSTYRTKLDELKDDQQGKIYIDEYSNHNLGKKTYNSEAHENTRTLIMDEFRFLKNTADVSDIIS
ncbi:MAG: hypothetical protein ACOCUH_03560, partial [Bacteriovoracia bacterium]